VRLLTARVSTKRRSPYAGVVVVLLGLLIAGSAYALLSPASAETSPSDQSAVAQGRTLFLVSCASCHGKNAQGVLTQDGTQYGPSLVGVGAAAVDFQVGTGRMPMQQPGVQAEQKPRVFSQKEISQLAAYIASLGPGPAIPARSSYDTSNAKNSEIAKGGDFFRTNCTACHNFAGSGGALPHGKFAPPLDGVPNKYVFEAMLTGPQQMPVFSNSVLKPQEKRDIIAYLNSIQTMPNYGGASLGKFGPVSEGLFAWVIGIGSMVCFTIWIAAHTARTTRTKKGAKA
jgi:ubiquinol-cytochrome c reductase cytochrome c subunit